MPVGPAITSTTGRGDGADASAAVAAPSPSSIAVSGRFVALDMPRRREGDRYSTSAAARIHSTATSSERRIQPSSMAKAARQATQRQVRQTLGMLRALRAPAVASVAAGALTWTRWSACDDGAGAFPPPPPPSAGVPMPVSELDERSQLDAAIAASLAEDGS